MTTPFAQCFVKMSVVHRNETRSQRSNSFWNRELNKEREKEIQQEGEREEEEPRDSLPMIFICTSD